MVQEKKRCFRKLSATIEQASIAEATDRLQTLRLLINRSAYLGEDISQLISQLRQVAAPAQEPFIFTNTLSENRKLFDVVFRDCDDVKYRNFKIGSKQALLVYAESMVGTVFIEESILKPLVQWQVSQGVPSIVDVADALSATSIKMSHSAREVITLVLNGYGVVLLEGASDCLLIDAVQYEKRPIGISENESVITGSNESFNDDLADSISLIRRRCRDNNIKVRMMHIGERSETGVACLYAANLVKPGLVEEVEQRLRMIKIDRVLASAVIAEYLMDHPWSPFPQVQSTERPDKVVSALYEGRVAIIVDNVAEALIVPTTYAQVLQSAEDYSTPALVTSVIRLTRFFSSMLAIFLPAFYIAVVSYHPGMLPTSLAISIAELRLRSPFPALLEVIFMEILVELFQEAVVRLPQKISGAAGVVGALIIGTTVVEAGLVNALLVVVIALTAIASYTMPTYNFSLSLRVLRVPVMIVASVLGLYGMALSFIVVVTHMCSIRSFGESYGGDLFNIILLEDWKDTFVRLPSTWQTARPKGIGAQERDRGGKEEG